MTNALFRQQAIDEQRNRLYGEVLITQPLSFYLVTFCVLLITVSIFLLLIYGTYARRETVVGYIVPDKGLVKIYASLQGVLSKNHIVDGQKVKKGDLLLTVSTLQVNEQGGDRDALLLTELENQKIDLQKKIDHEFSIYESIVKSFPSQLSEVNKELFYLGSSILLEQKHVDLTFIKLKKVKELFSKGYVPEVQVEESEKNHLDALLRLKSSQRQKIQLENKINDLSRQQKQAPFKWQSNLADFDSALSLIEQNIVEMSGRRVYAIRSPIAGRLTALYISEGQTLNTQTPLIAILPEGSELHAELFLPTRAAGFIAYKQNVYLRYAAFPYQHYGLHKGKVTSIDQVILTPNELPIPVALKEPVYRVKVTLDSQNVSAYGKEFSLQAGMLLDADIVLEERTLGQWLLEPIYGLRGKF